eukprot:3844658-Rhodomonas_salina.1
MQKRVKRPNALEISPSVNPALPLPPRSVFHLDSRKRMSRSEGLEAVFGVYCEGQATMDGKSFAKLSRDAKLLDSKLLTATDVDLTFAKIKAKAERRINFDQFRDGLKIFAHKKGGAYDDIKMAIMQCEEGPVLSGTRAEANKLHDDKSLYTGTFSPTGAAMQRSASRKGLRMAPAMTPDGKEVDHAMLEKEFGNSLKRHFEYYCDNPAQDSMDGRYFNKLAKDCDLLDANLTATDVDLAFAKVKKPDARRITYMQFLDGLSIFASKKGISLEDIRVKVKASQGPILTGTVAEANKFHDDKTLYTGVHAHGGPSLASTIVDLEKHLDRSPSDVRGVRKYQD